jgi:GT2 family glycosyltransferase
VPLSIASSIDEAHGLLRDAPSPVVVIPVYNSYDDVVQCLDAVAAHTPGDTAVLVVDDGGRDRRFDDVLAGAAAGLRHHVVVLRHAENLGFVRSCNDAFAATAGRDVVLLNSDVIVGPEWLTRLTDAASGDTTATASTLTNHGTMLSVPWRNAPTSRLPDAMSAHEASRRVALHSLRLRPTIPTAIGHCCYIRRRALDLVGGFDETFSPGYGEEVDFSQRCVVVGLRHVCADDVFTFHRGGRSFGDDAAVVARRELHEQIVNQRYPWYAPWVLRARVDDRSPLAHSIEVARRALLGLTVGVDALCLGPDQMGTQQVTVATIRALAARKDIEHLVVFVPPSHPRYVHDLRAELPDVEFVGVNPFVALPERLVDVVYRAYQVNMLAELDFLRRVADRFVVNHLDTIAFENPAYFGRHDEWMSYRDLSRLALHLADGVAFLSERSRQAVRDEGLLDAATPTSVVSCGVPERDDGATGTQPSAFPAIEPGFVLCMGASYRHKNRPFAVEVWMELRRRGWSGQLVLAGPHPPHGTSLAAEAALLLRHAELRPDVVNLATVTEDEKRWLYREAALVLYPSSIEGFGLVPFEAANHGTPTLATRQGSLDEVLPADIPVIDGFDVGATADTAWALLHDQAAATHVVEALGGRADTFRWERTADLLMQLFHDALAAPGSRSLVIEGEAGPPTGVMPRGDRAHPTASGAFERLVGTVIAHQGVKQLVSPAGSRRQLVVRRAISTARRRLR